MSQTVRSAFAAAFGALVLVSGCGGGAGSGGGTSGPEVDARIAEFTAMADRIEPLFNTGFTGQPGEVPNSGSATFTGYTGILLARPSNPLALLGDTAITIDFGVRTLDGSMTNFIGDDNAGVRSYAGTIDIINGEVGFDDPRGDTVPNDIRFDYDGTLSGGGNTVDLDGGVTGKFKGTPIRGLVAASDSETELLNGNSVDALITVVAEID